MAFASIEPFGEFREEFRSGKLQALLANINRNPDKKPDPFKPIDFMDFIEIPEEPEVVETPEQLSKRIASELFGIKR
jgi:hypothetical protein